MNAFLVVDDEDVICFLCRRILAMAGYDVVAESDPRNVVLLDNEAVQAVDLLLTDMTMPYMTGEKLALTMRSRKPGLPIIVMSGNMFKLPDSLKDIGSIQLISKPLERSKLLERIAILLECAESN